MKTLFEALDAYQKTGTIPFHMPGHKRHHTLGCPWDITEIQGFDDLHHPQGILRQIMAKGEALWGSDHSFLSVNGSTCGILAGIRSATKYGDEIIVARNCHKSVYHAIELCGLIPIYLMPSIEEETGIFTSITPEVVAKAFKAHPKATLVVLTSPTYEGVISDVKSISDIAHKYGVPVLVDEAHGGHLGFASSFVGGAVKAGADIVVESLHKTLLSLTQTAICHVNGNLVESRRFLRELNVFETSSPSYLLLASIDRCFTVMEKEPQRFLEWERMLWDFDQRMEDLNHLKVLCYGRDRMENHPDFFDFDRSKIVISTACTEITAIELKKTLCQDYGIELEMALSHYAIAMTGLGDIRENFSALAKALLEMDKKCSSFNTKNTVAQPQLPPVVFSASEAISGSVVCADLKDCIGAVSGSYLWAYPPGVPLVIPGEQITASLIYEVLDMVKNGGNLIATYGDIPKTLGILK